MYIQTVFIDAGMAKPVTVHINHGARKLPALRLKRAHRDNWGNRTLSRQRTYWPGNALQGMNRKIFKIMSMQFLISDERRKASGIYKITNSINAKVYVGSAFCLVRRYDMHKSRLARGIHHSRGLQCAANKHGLEKFNFELIEFCSKSDLINREQFWINSFNSYLKGYNGSPTAQNNAGMTFGPEIRKKVSEALKGHPCSEETRRKIGEAHRGKKLSLEQRQRISEVQTGKKQSNDVIKKRSTAMKRYAQTPEAQTHYKRLGKMQIGRKMPESYCKKLSERMKGKPGKPHTEDTKRRIGEKNKGRPKTPQQIELARQLMLNIRKIKVAIPPKPVNQYTLEGNFIKRWPSVTSTQEAGFILTNIAKVCRGKRKNAGGFKWQYAEN